MNSRDRILAAIRSTRSAPLPPDGEIAAGAAALLDAPDTTRPQPVAATLLAEFTRKAEALGTTFDHLPSRAAIPQAVRRYLDAHGLPPVLALQPVPDLAALDWSGIRTHGDIAPDEAAALGLALWGIAESGSLVVHSGADAPILLSFLPLHHIVVLEERALLPYLEDYAARMAGTAQPRNAILITGPSGTTDIEGSYVRGAHGPGFLHVLMVGA